MKNRRWGPVDLSQCVMDVDSPVVMILTVGLSNANASIVQLKRDQIVTEVCTYLQIACIKTHGSVSCGPRSRRATPWVY